MSQQFLYGVEVSAMFQQVSSEGMSKHMRRSFMLGGDPTKVMHYQALYAASGQGFLLFIDQQRLPGLQGAKTAFPRSQVPCQQVHQPVPERNDAFLVPFAQDPYGTPFQIDVPDGQSEKFGQTHSGTVEDLQDHPIRIPLESFGPLQFFEQPFHPDLLYELR
jgi:hypothetical protein